MSGTGIVFAAISRAQETRAITLGDHAGKIDHGLGHRALLRCPRPQQPQPTKKRGGHQHGRALRYVKWLRARPLTPPGGTIPDRDNNCLGTC